MTKKKVTAPLTYNPGKGRPKEHLAYLNYQEMQALKRLNGNNQERGPRGLPSFPPADATSGSYNSGYGSGGSRPSSGGPGGGMMGGSGSGGPSRTSPSSGRGDVGGRDSGTRDSVGANRPSSSGVSRGDVAGRDGGVRNVAGANTPDKSAINSANRTNTLSAQKSPAFKADTGRTVNVGPMGSPVKVGAPASRPSIPKATVQSPMAGQGASFASPLDARIENFQRINDARLKSGALGPEGVPSVSKIAAENARRLNAARMAQQYSQYRSPPRSYPAAPQGVYGPRAGVETSYLGTADMPGMITTGMTSPYSGTINPRFNAAQTLMAYEAEKRVPGKIQDRVPPTERFSTAKTRGIGAIPQSYPNTPPPGTYTERVLGVENVMSDAGIMKNIPGYAPSTPQNDLRRQGAGTYTSSYDAPSGYQVQEAGYVPDEAIPGFGIDPDNIPSYGGAVPQAQNKLFYDRIPPSEPQPAGLSYTYDTKLPPGYSPSTFMSDPFSNLPRYTEEQRKIIDEKIAAAGAPKLTRGIGDITPQSPDANGQFRRQAAGPFAITEDDPESLRYKKASQLMGQMSRTRQPPEEDADAGYSDTEAPAEDYGLVGEEAAKAAKKAGFPRNVYTNEDFLSDPDQLGLTREEVAMPLSPDDMAKVVNRSRALRYDDVKPYLTGPEKVRAKVSDVVERIVTFGAPTKAAVGAAKKLMSIESPEKFLSRPSYEQQALYEYAREANTRYRPGEAGVPQVGEPGGSGTVGGGSRFGRDGLGGGDKGNSGIASLGPKPKGDETTTPTPDTPSTTSGRRPDIYYMWDLGINIPSPSDPNYNQYQTYLAERLAAQRAMGYV